MNAEVLKHRRAYEARLLKLALNEGLVAKVTHLRDTEEDTGTRLTKFAGIAERFDVSPRGGRTEVVLVPLSIELGDDDRWEDYIEARGVALCSPIDNFDRREGRLIALRRALIAYLGGEDVYRRRIKEVA